MSSGQSVDWPGEASLRLITVAMFIMAAVGPAQSQPIETTFDRPYVDLMPVVQAIESLSPQASIDVPVGTSGERVQLQLTAGGPGPIYRWAVFSLRNPQPTRQRLVIVAPHQGLVGSGILGPLRDGSRALGLTASVGEPAEPLPRIGAEAFAVTLAPGTVATYALEVSTAGLTHLTLWRRSAFDAATGQLAFFRGVVLGTAILLGIAFLCLIIVKPRMVFPVGALFAWSAIAFLAIETGYLPTVVSWFPDLAGSEHNLRATVEALMLAGVTASLVTFIDLRRRMPIIGAVLIGVGGGAVALAVYGWFEPRLAVGLSRIGFAAVVAAGLVLIVMQWRQGSIRAQASLLGWAVLAAWTAVTAVGAFDLIHTELMGPLIAAGLVLVLVTMGFTLAQFAFNHGIISSRFFEEAGRRALALAGSEQAVWDWQVDEGLLHVGPEIERALGLAAGSIGGRDINDWLDLIHPADRGVYSAAVEAAERRGRGGLAREFRLRRVDGSYRWYLLRARALPGEEGRAGRIIGTLTDVTALRRSEDRLLSDAVRDRVTGLPNRALFLDRLGRAMRRAGGVPALHVIVLDLDRFKGFNDGLGHQTGDALLNTVGRRLARFLGPDDTLARLPGDQFGIIFSGANPPRDVIAFVHSLAAAVSRPIAVQSGEVVITASMGVAPFTLERFDPETLLKDAEIALYEAKRLGSGSVEFFRPDMADDRSDLLRMEQDLLRAVERGEIEVVYQPIVGLADQELTGFEALMRWRRAGTVIEPDGFLGLAEETGVIGELGRRVLDEAGRQLGIWQRAFRPQQPLFVAVNVSSTQLLNRSLVEDVRALLSREDLKPGTLMLEITESVVMENPELANKVLQRLKGMGVVLACDDFGTGYSALANLSRFHFDAVKIDRTFIEARPEHDERTAIVLDAVVRLARDLGLAVVAEGIETDEQWERLAALGCDYAQGYLIGPPVTAQQVVEALGGLPYGAESRRGIAGLWDRLFGRTEGDPQEAGAPQASSSFLLPAVDEELHSASLSDPSVAFPAGDMAAEAPDAGGWDAQHRLSPGELAEDEPEPVLDLTSILPSNGKRPRSSPPRVGTAAFAPRLGREPEPAADAREVDLAAPLAAPPAAAPAAETEANGAEGVAASPCAGDGGANSRATGAVMKAAGEPSAPIDGQNGAGERDGESQGMDGAAEVTALKARRAKSPRKRQIARRQPARQT